MDPAGKVAIVTGGTSGLGEATARALIEAGAHAISLDLNQATDIPSIRCDVTDPDSVAAAIAAVIQRWGHIHICVNSAGIGGIGPIATAEAPGDLATFRRLIEVNLMGAVHVTRLAAHHMIANPPSGPDGERGLILNACSIASFEGQEGMGAYTATKAALAGLTLVWARDLSRHGIRAMGIAPGFFATPMTAGIPAPLVQELMADAEFPRRPGTTREFAELALFILRNPMLNGDVIRLDGGTRPPARTSWAAG
jgi:NAD(P)-dependent dehydrogenase (short-subunit alcohol dehydrogenase family)